jgi:hypothetical protein
MIQKKRLKETLDECSVRCGLFSKEEEKFFIVINNVQSWFSSCFALNTFGTIYITKARASLLARPLSSNSVALAAKPSTLIANISNL